MTVLDHWAVVVRRFPDGSAWVRLETGEDIPLTAAQVGDAALGEAGLLVLSDTGEGPMDVWFQRGKAKR